MSDFIRDLKTSTHSWLDKSPNFPDFESWGKKYAALTYADKDKAMIVSYIKNQRIHHKVEPFLNEFRRLLDESKIEINEQYFLEE